LLVTVSVPLVAVCSLWLVPSSGRRRARAAQILDDDLPATTPSPRNVAGHRERAAGRRVGPREREVLLVHRLVRDSAIVYALPALSATLASVLPSSSLTEHADQDRPRSPPR